MKFYPENVNGRFQNPRFAGKLPDANGVGTNATFVCGAVLRLQLKIDPTTKEIQEAGFQTSGCGFLIASADVLAERIVGRKLTEFHGLDEQSLESEIEDVLGRFGNSRNHCFELPIKALQDALAEFRSFTLEEFAGEKALICTCFSVAEELIETVIKDQNLVSVEEVGDFCNAGTGCGSCQPLIQEILDGSHEVFN